MANNPLTKISFDTAKPVMKKKKMKKIKTQTYMRKISSLMK